MERVAAGGQGFVQDAVAPDLFEADAARLVLVEVSRMRPALTWRALDGDLVAGEVSARLRPDNRWFLYFDTWRADACPATYLVAVDRASGEYAGLVRISRNRARPRLGLIAMLAGYRRRGVARALLGQAFTVLAARGDTSVVGEVDDTNVASVSLLTGLGARRYGGNVELIRRQPGRSARDWPEERGPSAGR